MKKNVQSEKYKFFEIFSKIGFLIKREGPTIIEDILNDIETSHCDSGTFSRK